MKPKKNIKFKTHKIKAMKTKQDYINYIRSKNYSKDVEKAMIKHVKNHDHNTLAILNIKMDS